MIDISAIVNDVLTRSKKDEKVAPSACKQSTGHLLCQPVRAPARCLWLQRTQ